MPDQSDDFPSELYGAPLEQARTLPGRWYADPDHYAREMSAVFHRRWIGVACADDVAAPGSYVSTTVAGVPVLVTRDLSGTLRGFLNVCRHRGSPLADGCGHARALSCPYHGWVYRLDGSLARAAGVGDPVGFDMADFGLRPVQVTTFARSVLVNLDAELWRSTRARWPLASRRTGSTRWSSASAPGTNGTSTGKCCSRTTARTTTRRSSTRSSRRTATSTRSPCRPCGDRVGSPAGSRGIVRSEHCTTTGPGDAGWADVADVAADESFYNGTYLAVFPNVAISCFAGFAATFRLLPKGPSTTVVEREYYWHRTVGPERRASDLAATKQVVEQDLAMCEAIQGTYDAGLSADGVLSTEHESGVAHVHELLLGALAGR